MCCINPRNIAELLLKEFQELPKTDVNPQEIDLKDHIMDMLKSFEESSEFDIMSYLTLDMDEQTREGEEPLDEGTLSSYEDEDEDASSSVSSPNKEDAVSFEYKQKVVNFWRTPTKDGKKRTLSTVQKCYKRLKHARQLCRWADQVDKHGTKFDKLKAIKNATLNEFVAAANRGAAIHEVDIRRWAIDASIEQGYDGFKASPKFISNFKKENRVTSRKITKLVSRPKFNNEDGLREKASAFVTAVKPVIEDQGPQNVYNTDQSGFDREMCSGRTLAAKGVKKVEVVAQSINATTHSYTIQPLISGDGRVVGPLLVVLQEKEGRFGVRVTENIFRPDNVYVVASKSGKCTTEIMQTWYEDVFLPNTGDRSALLVDAWGGFKKKKKNVETSKEVTIHYIPEGTTGKIQPWDVFGARPWKHYVRRLSELLKGSDPTILLHERNNIIKIQSLTHRQLTSPRYTGLFQYSWYKVGYVGERGERFINPSNFAFDSLGEAACATCEDTPIVCCSWCRDNLCAEHFFVAYHDCNLFLP